MRSPRTLSTFPRTLGVAVLGAALLLTAGCGSSSQGDGGEKKVEATPVTPSTSASASPSESAGPAAPDTTTIDVHFQGDTVEPRGKVVTLDVGQKLVLDIQADAPGELHVHSTPEQEIEYPAGESKAVIVIDRPGVVEVESHTLDKLVLQLEVR